MKKVLMALWRISFISLLTLFTFFLHLAAWVKIGLLPLWLSLVLATILAGFVTFFMEEAYKQKLI